MIYWTEVLVVLVLWNVLRILTATTRVVRRHRATRLRYAPRTNIM